MIARLFEPVVFNWVIIGMFLLAAVRWGFAGVWVQVLYWLASAALVFSVTMMGAK